MTDEVRELREELQASKLALAQAVAQAAETIERQNDIIARIEEEKQRAVALADAAIRERKRSEAVLASIRALLHLRS